MSTLLRISTLLLFVVLGAGLAVCVALGVTPGDAIALCRGELLASSGESEGTDRSPDSDAAAGRRHAATAASANDPWPSDEAAKRGVSSPPGNTSPGARTDAFQPLPMLNAPAGLHSSRNPAASREPERLADAPKEAANPPAARTVAPRQPRDDNAARTPSSRAPGAKLTDNVCADPSENHEARLISIIQELVKQPHVQPVSARIAEPTSEYKKGGEPAGSSQPPPEPGPAISAAARPSTSPPANSAAPASVPPARPSVDPAPTGTARAATTAAKADALAAPPGIRITQAPAKKPGGAVEPIREGANSFQIFVKDEDIRQVLTLLGEAGKLNVLPSPAVTGNVSLSLANVSIMEALEAILKSKGLAARREGRFLYVGTPEEFLAQEKRKDHVATRIYRPNYVTANEIKNLLTPLMSSGVGKISITSQTKAGIESNDNQAGGNDLASREAVLVQDVESVLAQMDRVVLEIDRRPLQVAIEAMILSVKLDDQHQCGVDFQFLKNEGTIKLGLGSPGADLGSVNFTDGGLKFAYLDSNVSMFLKALETIGDTNVISTPRLLTLNKQRAEILIGAELGYVTTTVTETTATQSIDFLSVGTQLRIRPFISSDGMIRMEIHPELSTGQVRVEGGLTLPDKEVTKVTTNIMVRDGSTVIIGGLMREDLTKNARRIPFVGALPTIGNLFGSKDEKNERREILVLVTPRVVHDDEMHAEGEEAACEFHRRQNVFSDSTSPLGRSYLGRKYFRLAQEAWAAGNRERAIRYIDLSIHINPSERAAIDLRSDIMAGVRHGAHTLQGGPPPGPASMLPTVSDEPPVYLNEEAIEGAAPNVLPPGGEQVPNRPPPPSAAPSDGSLPAPESSRSAAALPFRTPTARKPVFPLRPGRTPQ